MTVTVKRIGGSLAVVIPRAIAAESGLAEGVSLDMSRTPAGILLRQPARRSRRSIAAIAAAIRPASYAGRARGGLTEDRPVGKEPG